MSDAHLRFIHYLLNFADQNRNNFDALQQEYAQISKLWNELASGELSGFINEKDQEEYLLKILASLDQFIENKGLWKESYIPWLERCLQSTHLENHLETRFSLLINLGSGYTDIGEPLKAKDCLEQALELATMLEDPPRQCSVLNNLAVMAYQLGDRQQALDYLQKSLNISKLSGGLSNQADVLDNIGAVYQSLGNVDKL